MSVGKEKWGGKWKGGNLEEWSRAGLTGERTGVVVIVVILREGAVKSFAGFGKDDEDLEVDGVRRDNRHDELDELGRWSFFST